MSESSCDDSSAADSVASNGTSKSSGIFDEFGGNVPRITLEAGRLKLAGTSSSPSGAPSQPPPSPPSSSSPSQTVFVAEPERVSSGFFPIQNPEDQPQKSRTALTTNVATIAATATTASAPSAISQPTAISASAALALKSIDPEWEPSRSIVPPARPYNGTALAPWSSLSTSLRTSSARNNAAGINLTAVSLSQTPTIIPIRANSAEPAFVPPPLMQQQQQYKQQQTHDWLSRRNSSGGGNISSNGIVSVAASEAGATGSSGRIGKVGGGASRFGSAPVEVPFANRNMSERVRAWNDDDDDDDDNDAVEKYGKVVGFEDGVEFRFLGGNRRRGSDGRRY
ncbi:hypothetical protein HK100_003059 [Physocladia obscura]|uniref:Uncharacterized protein n=1 Tax=Physocladia obscura TaxID=109957 RepID=A0AAD5SUS3_9FUNG|nr:hypothetical protein HK100_003059 [Physocladia obscura]